MAEDHRVNLEQNSYHRVTLELMNRIAVFEDKATSENAREYFLTLYSQCRQIVYNGHTFEGAMRATKPETTRT